MQIIAIDPGKVSGFAKWTTTSDRKPFVMEVHNYHDVARTFRPSKPDLAVCEQFIISQRTIRTAQDPSALRLIGWLDITCHLKGIRFELQSPGDAKRFVSNELLQTLGWYTPTPGGHANDALRHLFLAVLRHDRETADRLLKWRSVSRPRKEEGEEDEKS